MIDYLLVELLDSISKWGIRHGRVDRRGRVENESDFCAPLRVKLTVRTISICECDKGRSDRAPPCQAGQCLRNREAYFMILLRSEDIPKDPAPYLP